MPRTKEQDREYQRLRRAQKAAEAASGAAAPTKPAGKGGASAKRSARVHRDAVSRMLRSTGLANVPEEAPLVALVKELAREMDEAPSASTSSRYRVALADVRRVLDAGSCRVTAPVDSSKPDPEDTPEPTKVSSLASFKAERGIA